MSQSNGLGRIGLGAFGNVWEEGDIYRSDMYRPGMDDWWQRYVYDSTQRGMDILGARYGRGDYHSPDDPRYRQQQGGAYPPQHAGGGAYVPGTVSTQGFQINWWTAALIGVVAGAFFLGKKGK